VLYPAQSALHAANAARESVAALDALPAIWFELAKPRRGSADEKIIPWLLERPVFEAHSAAQIAGVAESSIYAALERLTNAGVISNVVSSRWKEWFGRSARWVSRVSLSTSWLTMGSPRPDLTVNSVPRDRSSGADAL
jgi:hypothetical protein